jgi:hypothetical protein
MLLSPAISLCTGVELKLSLRTHLALRTHARRIHNRREVYCQPSPSALLTENDIQPSRNVTLWSPRFVVKASTLNNKSHCKLSQSEISILSPKSGQVKIFFPASRLSISFLSWWRRLFVILSSPAILSNSSALRPLTKEEEKRVRGVCGPLIRKWSTACMHILSTNRLRATL